MEFLLLAFTFCKIGGLPFFLLFDGVVSMCGGEWDMYKLLFGVFLGDILLWMERGGGELRLGRV